MNTFHVIFFMDQFCATTILDYVFRQTAISAAVYNVVHVHNQGQFFIQKGPILIMYYFVLLGQAGMA
jgi:hypothetical protein